MITDKKDSELIDLYLNKADQTAFETLLKRYYDHTIKVLRSSGMPAQDTEDACQQVWIKIIRALPNYKDEGKFGALVTTAAKNLCKDYWKGSQNQKLNTPIDDEENQVEHDAALTEKTRVDSDYENAEAISKLTGELIPSLSPELRNVFLLKHEAEYWDNKRPLSWSDVARLYGITLEESVSHFITARDTFIQSHHETTKPPTPVEEALGVFLLWTQSQRCTKNEKQTEPRLASLLGIPVNTFKTRYKRARETLASGLGAY